MMNFDYDKMPRRNKEHSNGKIMRDCKNCEYAEDIRDGGQR